MVSILNGAGSNRSSAGYSPETITIVIGINNTVIWTNNDAALHTVTSGVGGFYSTDLGKGGTYTFTFTVAGTYVYFCIYHGWMHGTVIVKEKP